MAADLGDLTAFVAVARSGGFRDAARASGRSASSLSEAVSRLEARLGVPVFDSIAVTLWACLIATGMDPARAGFHLDEVRLVVARPLGKNEDVATGVERFGDSTGRLSEV